jgi:hypothetical protein
MDFGLPEGFLQRVSRWDLGAGLTVHFASRLDQIHLKLYALVDQGLGKHEGDLRALTPSREELIQAARWTRIHEGSFDLGVEVDGDALILNTTPV